MGRIERKQGLNNNKNKPIRKTFCILMIFLLMILGIIKVDDSFRNMMKIDGPKVFQYERLNQDTHQVFFCGESFRVDERKIRETMSYFRREINVFLETIKNQID